MGGVLFYKSKFLVSSIRTCHDPVSSLTVTTCTNGTAEHTEDVRTGHKHFLQQQKLTSFCSAPALCQIGNTDGKRLNCPVVPLSERNLAGRAGQPRTLWLRGAARKQWETRNEEHGILEYNSTSDDEDIPSLEREANSLLGRGSRFGRSIRFNSRVVFSKYFFIYIVMEQRDCRHLLSFMHLLTLLFVSLILTYLYWSVFGAWSKLNGRKSLPWLALNERYHHFREKRETYVRRWP